MNCADLFVAVATAALGSQCPDGSMPPGHNGPYRHPETPLRNSAHWLQGFLKAFALSGNPRYRDAAERIAGMLLQPALRPGGFTFHCRSAPGATSCSGLIGQAWAIEALATAWSYFESQEHAALALEVFRAHPFDAHRGLWEAREVDGTLLGPDRTLNHQMWFASAAARLIELGESDVRQSVEVFLDRLTANTVLYPNGLIYQDSILYLELRRWRVATIPTRIVGSRLFPRSLRRTRAVGRVAPLYMKCVGYHTFCAHALASLKKRFPSHPLWQTQTAGRILGYLLSAEFAALIDIESRYGYAYNAPGFEVPYAAATLMGGTEAETVQLVSSWVTQQVAKTFNPQTLSFDRNTPDAATLTARLYEMSELPDRVLREAMLGDLGLQPATG